MTAPATTDYTDLITSEHHDKPKFMAVVGLFAQFAVDLRTVTLAMPQDFDVDTAVGAQLDALAAWVGASREITIQPTVLYPAPAQAYVYNQTDAELRSFVKARILANFWDGTPQTLPAIFTAYLNAGQYGAELDDLDMSITIYLTGTTPTPAQLAVISQFLLPIRPAGVLLNGIWISGGGPLFGLDVENNFIAGPDVGSFGTFSPGP